MYNVLSKLQLQQEGIVIRLALAILVAACAWSGRASAQCGYYPYPVYPPPIIYLPVYPMPVYPPPFWGAPTPKPLPPAPPPFVPKARVTEDEPGNKDKNKPNDPPKIPKTNLLNEPEPKKLPAPKPADKEDLANIERKIDEFLIAGKEGKAEPSKEVKIGFFNHSGKDLTLDVNGETVTLPSEQYVTLRLPRQFAWSIKGEKNRDVKVPSDADGLEIVFRK